MRHKHLKRSRVFRNSLAASLVTILSANICQADWTITTIDTAGFTGGFPSLQLTSADLPRISYQYGSSKDLRYASSNGTSFNIQTADSFGATGVTTSLALDNLGNPHIAYRQETGTFNGDLRYATFNGTSWSAQTVAIGDGANFGDGAGLYPTIALNSSALPRIVYWDDKFGIRFAAFNGATWDISTVSSEEGAEFPSLALDSAGVPHVSYREFYSGELRYATYNGASWDTQVVDDLIGASDGFTSIALDASGRPHIAYGELSGYQADPDLRYAFWNGTSWERSIIDNSADRFLSVSLKLDGAGQPRMSYGVENDIETTYDTDLKFAALNGSVWEVQTIDSVGAVGAYNSLALDHFGNPRIAYDDQTSGDLKYAVFVPEPGECSLLLAGFASLWLGRHRAKR